MISIGIDMGTTTISAVAFETKEGPERGAGVCGGAGSGCGQTSVGKLPVLESCGRR